MSEEKKKTFERTPLPTVNGDQFKRAIQGGLAWLQMNHEYVNSLNVFPVPDGDTGTNMLLTMKSAWEEIETADVNNAADIAYKLYHGSLMGARGNSGVILSQLWRGFARGLENIRLITAKDFALSLREAGKSAYSAVQEPVEGTLLTVAKDAGNAAVAAAETSDNLIDILDAVVKECYASVQRTPDLLPVLRDAGVVDSGGMGFTYIMEGMLRYSRREYVGLDALETEIGITGPASGHVTIEEVDLDFPYDVQFLIKGEDLDVVAIRADIEAMGDSGVIAGDERLVKVHIHVVNPGVPIGYGASKGALLDVVVENMQEQFHEFAEMHAQRPVMPVARATNMRPAIKEGSIAVIAVAPGDGFRDIFYSLGAGHVIEGGQTMNPSTAEILDAVRALPTDKVIILPNNKNIFMAAQSAAEAAEGKEVIVVPTRTIPQGVSALLSLDADGDLATVADEMEQSAFLVQTGEVTTATRTAKVDGVQVTKGQVIGLHNDVLKVAGEAIDAVTFDLLEVMGAPDMELITIYYGNDVAEDEAQQVLASVVEAYPDHEVELRYGGQAHYFYVFSVE